MSVEELKKEDAEDTDDDMPTLEEPAGEAGGSEEAQASEGGKQNRAEKKARKALSKLGLRQIPGILRVTVKKAKNILFVIAKPDVYKSPSSDTYIVFGEAKIEDMTSQAQAQAAGQFQSAQVPAEEEDDDDDIPDLAEAVDDDDEEVDETGLDPDEIQTVMSQANASRAKAVKALKKHSNIVDAILELTP